MKNATFLLENISAAVLVEHYNKILSHMKYCKLLFDTGLNKVTHLYFNTSVLE